MNWIIQGLKTTQTTEDWYERQSHQLLTTRDTTVYNIEDWVTSNGLDPRTIRLLPVDCDIDLNRSIDVREYLRNAYSTSAGIRDTHGRNTDTYLRYNHICQTYASMFDHLFPKESIFK